MTEPFMYLIDGALEEPLYCEPAPVDFKNPLNRMSLVPMTSRIMSMDRGFYTSEEVRADGGILKSAYRNTLSNRVSRNTDNDFVSIRSDKTEMPCAAAFMLSSREKLFDALGIAVDDYYVIFITSDEVMFAKKSDFKPTQIRKVTANIRNKLNSLFPDNSPVLRTEVFVYDRDERRYKEA